MIHKLWNSPHVLWQTGGEDELPNKAIAACIDNGGTIVLRQEDAEIVINKQTVPDLCKLLKLMQGLAP